MPIDLFTGEEILDEVQENNKKPVFNTVSNISQGTDLFSSNVSKQDSSTHIDLFTGELINKKPEMDTFDKVLSGAKEIGEAPSPLEYAIDKTYNQAKNIINSSMLGIPGLLDDRFKPKGLSTKEEIQGGVIGASLPITAGYKFINKSIVKPIFKSFGRFVAPGKRTADQIYRSLKAKVPIKYNKELKIIKDKFATIVDESVGSIKHNVNIMTDELIQASDKASLSFQNMLPKFFKANSKAFGDKLDEIVEYASRSGEGVTRGELGNIYRSILKEIEESGITGSARELIEQLSNKYKVKIIAKPSKFFRASDAIKPTKNFSNVDDIISFKELYSDYRAIGGSLSSKFKSGTYGFSPEDIAVSIYKSKIGDLLTDVAPQLKELNAAYRPVINAKKMAYKIFKPTQGNISTKSGELFIRRGALGKLAEGEKRFISTIEKGSDLAVGVGDLTAEANRIGNQINKLKNSIEPTKKLIQSQKGKAIDAVNIARQKRIDQLLLRKKKIELLEAQRKKANMIKAELIGGGIAIGALGGGIAALKSHVSR